MIQFLWLIWIAMILVTSRRRIRRGIGNSDRDTMHAASSIGAPSVFMECRRGIIITRSGKECWISFHPPRSNDSNGPKIDVDDIIGSC